MNIKKGNSCLILVFTLIIVFLGNKAIAQNIEFTESTIYLNNKVIEEDLLRSLLPTIKVKKLKINISNSSEIFSFDIINQLNDIKEIDIEVVEKEFPSFTLSDCISHGLKLDSFKNIEKISFSDYYEIPKELYKCKKLKEISVSLLSEFRHCIAKTDFPELQNLNIDCFSIILDDSSISDFYKLPLVKLRVSARSCNIDFSKINGAKLRTLSLIGMDSINLDHLTPINFKKLEKFSFESSNLERVPDSLFYLPKLKTVNLKNNKISSIPLSISKAVFLEEIQISENKLIKLPSYIAQLSNLKRLDVRFNFIEEFPKEFVEMKNLVDFYVLVPYKLNKRDKGYMFIKDKMTWCTFYEDTWKNFLFLKVTSSSHGYNGVGCFY